MPALPRHISSESRRLTLQDRLQAAALRRRAERAPATGPPDGPPALSCPEELFAGLEASGRFQRDSGLGKIFHLGRISLRERQPTNSLHLVIDGDRVAAHVDRVSPLGRRPEQRSRYSLRQAAAHNVVGMVHDLVRLLRGRQGDHRCELDCEWLTDPSETEPQAADLLDPTASTWSVHLEAHVTGTLDEARLRRAIVAALGRGHRGGEVLEAVDCPDSRSLEEARVRHLSLPTPASGWSPVRAVLARGPAGDALLLNLNHADFDGTAARQLLHRIAEGYSRGAGGPQPAIEPEPYILGAGDLAVRPASAPVSALRARYRRGVERLRDRLARPIRLAPEPGPDEADAGAGHAVHLVCLSTEQTGRIVNGRQGGITNDILLAALHLAIGDWNLRHGSPGRRVGVLVPVDLRPPGWPEQAVGNFSVTARISTSRRHRAGPASALKEVRAQTTLNKRVRSGTALLAALVRSGLLPLWGKQSLVVLQPLTRNRLVDTAMLADLGPLEPLPSFGAGAGDTVGAWFSVPARSPLCLCIGATTVGGRLHLTFRYPRRLFGADAARRFADRYLEHLAAVGGEPSSGR